MRARRFDRSRLGKAAPGPAGARLVPAYVSSVGVFPYRQPDGKVVREYRPAEEVFHVDSLASLHLAPVTVGHPTAMVDAATWRETSVGFVAVPPVPDDDKVSTSLLVADARALADLDTARLDECSCGYDAEIDETPGTWEGKPYDVVQRQIRYNHVALGPPGWGRHGPEVSVRLDAAEEIAMTNEEIKAKIAELQAMLKEEAPPAADAAGAAPPAPAAGAAPAAPPAPGLEPRSEFTVSIEQKARADAAEARVRKLEAQMAEVPELVRADVAAREKAKSLGVERVDGIPLDDVYAAAIKLDDPAFDASKIAPEGRSLYLKARFDGLKVTRTDFSGTRTLPSTSRQPDTSNLTSSEAARLRMHSAHKQAWQRSA